MRGRILWAHISLMVYPYIGGDPLPSATAVAWFLLSLTTTLAHPPPFIIYT